MKKYEDNTRKFTLEYVKNELKDKFEVLSYTDASNVRVKCKLCGYEYTGDLYTLRKSKKCINCYGRKKISIEDAQRRSDEQFGPGILIKDIIDKQYKTCKKRFVICEYNGKEYKKSLSEFFIYGIRREAKRNIDAINHDVEKISSGKYSILDTEFRGRKANIHFIMYILTLQE